MCLSVCENAQCWWPSLKGEKLGWQTPDWMGRQADKRAEISVQADRWVEWQMGRLESGLTSK